MRYHETEKEVVCYSKRSENLPYPVQSPLADPPSLYLSHHLQRMPSTGPGMVITSFVLKILMKEIAGMAVYQGVQIAPFSLPVMRERLSLATVTLQITILG